MSDRIRVLVLVVVYNAESTLVGVLDRLPIDRLADLDLEVLVIDDASEDRTFELGRVYRSSRPQLPLTILRNPVNQGYGGNQKVGYTYAVEEGFDLVAMIHRDGQYAPEVLPDLLAPLLAGEAEAVMGSRMMPPGRALEGGMPLYKFVGNRILSRTWLLGTDLTEFHSGYRVFSVAALRRVRFQLNTNDFHFDTEIVLQLLHSGARVVERPIPTYYGEEICRVDGLAYARNVMIATTGSLLHRVGLSQQKRLEPLGCLAWTEDSQDAEGPPGNAHYDLKIGYASSHQWAVDTVPPGARVPDLGSGPEGLGRLLAERGCRVTVVDRYPPRAPTHPDVDVLVADLEHPLDLRADAYDLVLLLDGIEHLADPEAFLARLRANFGDIPPRLVLTTPNVAFVVQRLMLLAGQFNSGREGILDRDHKRLFTFRTLRHLLRDAGFRNCRVRGVPVPFPKALGDTALAHALVQLNLALIRVSRTLFSYQIMVEADGTADLDHVIRAARGSGVA